MKTAQIEHIRQLVLDTLAELGVADCNWSLVTETVLLRDHRYAGRKFQGEGIRAVWLADKGVLEFYDEQDTLLKTITIEQGSRDHREVA